MDSSSSSSSSRVLFFLIKTPDFLFSGTDNGLVGELRMEPNSIKPGWLLQNVRGLGSWLG